MTSLMKLFFSSSFASALRRGRSGGGACLAGGRARRGVRGAVLGRGLRAARAVAVAAGVVMALGVFGAAQAQAQTCTLDVARGFDRTTPDRLHLLDTANAGLATTLQLGFTVSSGCASVITTGPLRIAYMFITLNAAGTSSTNLAPGAMLGTGSNGTLAAVSNRGTAAANGRQISASYWDFTASEVQAAANAGTTLNIPVRVGGGTTNINTTGGFRYALARRCHNRDGVYGVTGSADSGESVEIATSGRVDAFNTYGSTIARSGRCNGFDASTADPTSSSHPMSLGHLVVSHFTRVLGGQAPRVTAVASATSTSVSEGGTISLSGSGSTAQALAGATYQVDWSWDQLDANGDNLATSSPLYISSIATASGVIGSPGAGMATFGVNTSRFDVSGTAPQVSSETVLYFRLTLESRRLETFTPPIENFVSTSVVQVTVSDASATPTPVADAGSDQTVTDGTVVTLTGTATRGSGDTTSGLSQVWTQVESESNLDPVSTAGTITNAGSLSASFTAPNVDSSTEYFFALTVRALAPGLSGSSHIDVVKITVTDDDSPTASITTTDGTVAEGGATTLASSVGANGDSDTPSAKWTASPTSPAVSFDDDTSLTATVTWPSVTANTDYTLTLTATDAAGNTGTDTVMFTVQNAARPTPTANAGTDASADDGDSVTLTGTGTRASGDTTSTLSYAWVQVTSESDRTALTTAGTITNANALSASFTAPNVLADTDFFFQLTVTASATGDADSTATDVVKIAVEDDDAPSASISTAGATVNDSTPTQVNGTVTANALDSADTIGASWSSSPTGPTFTPANAASTSVTWPDVSTDTTYTLTLTATDSAGNTDTDTVMFTVQDTPLPANATPTVTVGAAQTVDEGAAVTLSGTVQRAASDTTGTLDYAWVQITSATDPTPITSGANYVGALTNGSGTPAASPLGQSNASFTAPAITASPFTRTYHFQLTGGAVNTGVTSRATATGIVSITVNDNTAPSASISTAAATVDESTDTTMSATGTDSEGDTVTVEWTVSPSGPTFDDDSILGTQVTWPAQAASASTAYTLTLTVEDTLGNQATDTVIFTVRDTGSPTASTSGSASSGTVNTTVNLSGSSSRNAAGSASGISYAWVQTASSTSSTALTSGDAGYVALAGATTATPSFTAPATAATLHFLLTVTDDVTTRTATARAMVAITLAASAAPTVDAGSDQTGIDDFDSGGAATTITLAGSAAKDPAVTGTPTFAYTWTQVSAETSGTEVTSGANYAGAITNANAATATVSAPDVATTATIYFQLSVTATESGKGASPAVTDVVAITVTDNEAPTVAFTPAARNVDEGATTTFANTSSDPDGDATLTYAWTVDPSSAGTFGDPAGTSSTPATLAAPNIVWADVAASVRSLSATVRLTVTDSQNNSAFSEVIYSVLDKNGVPTAVAFAANPLSTSTPYPNNRVLTTDNFSPVLNAGNSRNAGGGTSDLTYSWIQVVDATSTTRIPNNHPDRIQLSNPNTSVAQLNIVVRVVTTRHFLLTVTDTQTGQTAQARIAIMYVLPSAVVIDQIGASATQAAVSEGGSFGFRATRRDGQTDVDGELTIVATLSATPSTTDNDYETADFAAGSGNLVVAAADENDSDYTVIDVQNDTLLEGTEAFRVTFTLRGSTIPVIVDGTNSNTWDGSITDTDAVEASIARMDTSPPDNAFTEGGSGAAGTAVFTVTVSGAELTAAADVTFTVSGGTPPGATGNDYTVTPAADAMGVYTLTVNPSSGMDSATGTITLTQVDDNLLENPETITVTLTAASSAGTVSVSSTSDDASADLASDDMPVASIARATDNDGFTERASGSAAQTSFTVTLGAELTGNVTIPFSVTGDVVAADYDISAPGGIAATATGGSITINAGDTTGTITIDASDDLLLEGDETLTVELGASITGGGTLDGSPVTVTRHSTNYTADADLEEGNSLSLGVSASGTSFTEGASGASGEMEFSVTLFHQSLSGVETTQATTVNFTVNGCGAGGEQCAFAPSSGVLTIDAGDDNGVVTVTQVDDDFNEPEETIAVTVTGASSAGETISVSGASDSASLQDDDDITVTISRASGTGAVDEAGSVDFTVALSGGIRVGALTVPFSVTGDLLGAEYDITAPPSIPAADTGGEVVFPAADPDAAVPIVPTATDSMTITVDLLGDDVNEATENLIVTGTPAGASGLRTANNGGVAYAGGGGNTVSVDVSDDDDITVTLVPASGTDTDTTTAGIQVNEGTTVTLTVTMDHASAANVDFVFTSGIMTQANMGDAMDSDSDANTIDANSGANPDFTSMGENSDLPSAAVRVLAGETTADITLDINADRIREGEETLTVALMTAAPATGAGTVELGTPVSVDLLIAPSTTSSHLITLTGSTTPSPTSLDEDDAATTFTITRTGPAITMGTTLDVTWTFAAGDTVAADFQGGTLPTSGTVMFSGSETTKTFTIDPAADNLAEGGADGAEEFTLTLSAASTLTEAIRTAEGGVQIVTSAHTVQIVDPDDALVVAIHSLDNTTVNEDTTSSTRTATWRISVTGAISTAAVTVPFSFSGTGITAADYDITAPTGVDMADTSGEITIASGDGGTASNCASCGTITIEVTDDNLIEGSEALELVLGAPTGGGGLIGLSAAVVDMDTGMTTTRAGGEMPTSIADDDTGTVSIVRTDTDGFTENAAAEAGTAIFTVTLTGGMLSAALDVNYMVDGCGAGEDNCFDGSGSTISIGTGSTSGTITITQVNDDLNEGDETITVTLTSVSTTGTVNIPASPGDSAGADLADDDDLTVTASRTSGQEAAVDEGATGVSFTVEYSGGALTGALDVPFTIGGTGITAGDYDITEPTGLMASATGGTLTIPDPTTDPTWDPNMDPPTSGSGVITVTISDDALNEAAETLELSLTTGSVTTTGDIDSVTDSTTAPPSVSINANDAATVSVARTTPAGDAEVDEGTPVTFTVTLTASSGDAVMVPWTAVMGAQSQRSGEADNSDAARDLTTTASGTTTTVSASGITTVGGTLEIAANTMSGTVEITPANDGLAEGDESFTFTIAAPTAGTGSGMVTLGSPVAVTVGVDENDAAAHIVTIADISAPVSEGGMASFTLSLPAATGANARSQSLTLTYTVGGMVETSDYTDSTGGAVTFAAPGSTGDTEQTVQIAIADDSLNEGDETLTVTLGAVTMRGGSAISASNSFPGGAIGRGAGSVTISANDAITYSIDDPTGMEPTNGQPANAQNMTYTVTLTGASEGAVTIPFTISSDSTATAGADLGVVGADYATPAALQFVVAAGMTTATVDIALRADNVHEADETIIVVLGDTPSVGAGGGMVTRTDTEADYTSTGTIGGNDAIEVEIALANAAQSPVTEGASVDVRVTLAGNIGGRPSAGYVDVTYTTAIASQLGEANTGAEPDLALPQNNCGDTPMDVTVAADGSATGCIRIPAGMSSLQFSIEARYDGRDEDGPDNDLGDEMVTVTLDSFASGLGTGAPAVTQTAIPARRSASFAINNVDSRRQLSVAASTTTVEEGDGTNTVSWTLTMTGADVESEFAVDWSILATSTAGADDTTGTRSGTLAIPAGHTATSAALAITTLTIADDALNEGPETLVLRITEASGSPLETAGGRPDGFAGPATTFSARSATATIGANDPIAASIARRSSDTGRLVSGDDANYVVSLGATASSNLTLTFSATLGGSSLTVPAQMVTAGQSQVDVTLPAATIGAATAAASGEVQLAVSVSGVTGAPSGATAGAASDGSESADAIGVVGWELSLSPTSGADTRIQVGEGGALALTVSLRGTPAPTALMIPWSVAGGVAGASPACGADASMADFMGGAFPSGTLDLSGQTSGSISAQTAMDTMDESMNAECFTLTLGTFTGAQAGAVVVEGGNAAYAEIADASRTIAASVTSATVAEGGMVEFTITMRGTVNPTSDVAVPWTLSSPDSSLTLSGEGSDLGAGEEISGTATFASGTDVENAASGVVQMVSVAIADDVLNEGPEMLLLTIGDVPEDAGGQDGNIPGTLVSTRTASATVSASDDIAVSLARRSGDTARLVNGDAARFTATLGAGGVTASPGLMLGITATLGSGSVTLPNVAVPTGSATVDFEIPGCNAGATPPVTTGCIDAGTAAASGEVQLAVSVSSVTGAPTGATADPATGGANAAGDIPVIGWELSISPTGSATQREQVGEGGPFAVTVTLRGTPGPGDLDIPWMVSSGVSAMGQTCAGSASALDFMGNALPSGTLTLDDLTTGTITVQTASDDVDESNPDDATNPGPECFTLALGTLAGSQAGAVVVVGASEAYAEIADALRTLSASVVNTTVDEDSVTGAGETANVQFTITLRGTVNPDTPVEVPWTLSSPDDSLTLSAGGASGVGASSLETLDLGPGAAVSGTVTFPASTDVSGAGNTMMVSVPIAQDALNEGPERLQLAIGTVPQNAGGMPGSIPGTLVSTRQTEATVSASDDITVFLAPDPNQGTLTAGEAARYTVSFGTTTVNGQVVPIVPTTEVRIPLMVQVGGTTVTIPPAAAGGGNAQVEAGPSGTSGQVVVPVGSTQVTLEIPPSAINAQGQSGTPMLTVAAQTPMGTPTGAEARAATMQDAAAETQRTGQTVTPTPPPAQVAGWELTVAQPDMDQAPEGTGYRVTFTVEGDTAALSGGIQIPWFVASHAAQNGGQQAVERDFGRSESTPPAYNCTPRANGACTDFPMGTVTIATGAAALTTLVIEIFDDGVEEGMTPEGFAVSLGALAGSDAARTQAIVGGMAVTAGAVLGDLAAEIPALRVDLSVANAVADEGANAEFVLTLANFSGGERTTQPISVTFALASGPQPGGAQLGVDFRPPASLTTSIAAGATEGSTHTIPVWLVPDGLPEPPETFTLRITAASGGGGTVRLVTAAGEQTAITATGTISGAGDAAARRGERVSTLVSVLDRSTAILAADAIGQRLDRGMPGSVSQDSQLSIANRNLLGEANARAAASDLGLALYGAPGMGGAAAGLPGEGAGVEAAAAFGGLGVGLSGGANLGRNMALPSLAEVLNGSSFNFSARAAAWTDLSTMADDVEVWGSGGYTDLSGDPQQGGSKLDYDGDNFAFFVGADRPLRPDLLAGVAVGYSVGDLDFTDTSDGFTTKGNLSTSMLSVHPYVGWWLTPNLNTWLMLGYGSGSVDVDETDTWALGATTQTAERTLPGNSDSNMWMIATGVAGRVQVAQSTGVKLSLEVARVHSELDAARFDDGALLPKLSAHSLRMGGEAEVNHLVQIGMVQIRPFVSARMRIETGDAVEQGAGQERDAAFDVGGGVSAQLPDLGIDGRISVSGQLNETGHEERRVSVDLNYDLSGDAQGLTLAVQTAIRQRKTGLLNGLGTGAFGSVGGVGGASSLGGSLSGGVGQMEQSISGEIGYGMAFQQFGRSGLLTPYGRFDLGQDDSLYAAGLRLNANSGLSLGLEGVLDPQDSYQLRLTGQLNF